MKVTKNNEFSTSYTDSDLWWTRVPKNQNYANTILEFIIALDIQIDVNLSQTWGMHMEWKLILMRCFLLYTLPGL